MEKQGISRCYKTVYIYDIKKKCAYADSDNLKMN